MASTSNYADLFDRLLQGKLSPEEAGKLIGLLAGNPPDPQTAALLEKYLRKPATQQLPPETTAALEARLPAIFAQKKQQSHTPLYRRAWFRYSAAAAVLACIVGIGTWRYKGETPPLVSRMPGKVNHPVAGNTKNIILTLDNGQRIKLDSAPNGLVTRQNGAAVQLNNGSLAYKGGGAAGSISYNTLSVPRGRLFQLVLPDGTRVWLNAASTMRYPTAFTGRERRVEITGEAYFEVAKNPALPFRIKVQDRPAEIEVLGTCFNVNAYGNEASVNTTLVEGSVKIASGNSRAVIRPGQQAQISSRIRILDKADMQKVLAWKEGIFNFEDAGLEEVMRQLERWYDIEVVYEKGIPPLEFVGKMGRDLSLQEVLRGLEISEVHFSMQGRKLIVKP